MGVKKLLLNLWRILPGTVQELASRIIRPRYQVAVGAMIFNQQGFLLLCKHTYRRIYPWGLPGGDLKIGEDPEDGIKREIYEETGLKVSVIRLLLIENSKERHHLNLTYICSDPTGEFIPNDEVASIEFFDPDHLPSFLPEQGRTIERALKKLQAEKE